ncbi:MAG: hypothetical protein ABIH49_01145 [archaeon]
MEDEVRERLEKMIEEGKDSNKILTICMVGKGIKYGEEEWFNRDEDSELYDGIMVVYKTPAPNESSPRISHGICKKHFDEYE